MFHLEARSNYRLGEYRRRESEFPWTGRVIANIDFNLGRSKYARVCCSPPRGKRKTKSICLEKIYIYMYMRKQERIYIFAIRAFTKSGGEMRRRERERIIERINIYIWKRNIYGRTAISLMIIRLNFHRRDTCESTYRA